MLAMGADVSSDGKVHLFGAGFDTLEVPKIPANAGPFYLVVKLSGDSSDPHTAHTLTITGIRVDGESTQLFEQPGITFPPAKHEDQPRTFAASIVQVGLHVTRPGKFQFAIDVDGEPVGSVPLWIVDKSSPVEGSSDA